MGDPRLRDDECGSALARVGQNGYLERLPPDEASENHQKILIIDLFMMVDKPVCGKIKIDMEEFVWNYKSEIPTEKQIEDFFRRQKHVCDLTLSEFY